MAPGDRAAQMISWEDWVRLLCQDEEDMIQEALPEEAQEIPLELR